jgi:hypothetical protein
MVVPEHTELSLSLTAFGPLVNYSRGKLLISVSIHLGAVSVVLYGRPSCMRSGGSYGVATGGLCSERLPTLCSVCSIERTVCRYARTYSYTVLGDHPSHASIPHRTSFPHRRPWLRGFWRRRPGAARPGCVPLLASRDTQGIPGPLKPAANELFPVPICSKLLLEVCALRRSDALSSVRWTSSPVAASEDEHNATCLLLSLSLTGNSNRPCDRVRIALPSRVRLAGLAAAAGQ